MTIIPESESEFELILIHIRQCVRTNEIPPNESRDICDLSMWLLNFTFSDNHINYLKKKY